MQFLYVDESGGDFHGTKDKFFVLAGVSVGERVPFHLSKQVDEIQEALFPGVKEPIEFRASAIWNKNGEPWNSMDRATRNGCMKSLYRLIGGDNRITLFGI